MSRASEPRKVTELFAEPGEQWPDSVAYREREAEWQEEYRQVKVARGTALPFFVLAPLCAYGFVVLPGLWSLAAAAAGLLVLVVAAITFAGAPAFQRRLDRLERERREGLRPSPAQVRDVLTQLRPGPNLVHIFPDGRVVRFDSAGIHVANIADDRFNRHRVAEIELPDESSTKFDVVVHTADGNMIFPFGPDGETARAACDALKAAAGTDNGVAEHAH